MAWLRRISAAIVLVCVLADASACLIAFENAPSPAENVTVSALCPCGCKAHTGPLSGIGLTQLAAPPAQDALPNAPRVRPEPAVLPLLAAAPVRPIDHVPILDA